MALRTSQSVRSWGRVVKAEHLVVSPQRRTDLQSVFEDVAAQGTDVLAHGLGRSYGDSCLNPEHGIVKMRGLDRFIAFDKETGILRAEAGVSLGEIMQLVVPHGFFLHTTPGTRFVTLGGALGNDVHGKNHHVTGSFGQNVRAFGLVRSDRGELTVTAESEPELFAATIGGLGMTGIISWVEMQMVPISSGYIDQDLIPIGSLDEFFSVMEEQTPNFEHTVAWVDCTASGKSLGRGIFTGGNWAKDGRLEAHENGGPNMPIDAPGFTLNPLSLKSFNNFYNWWQKQKAGKSTIHYAGHFHPLDAIQNWNRLYGSKGFYQYQSIIPFATARDATREMLELVSRSGQGSMLAVLKTLGNIPGRGHLSFPMEGVTLALDFQNKGQKTIDLMEKMDEVVKQAGGRLYPAKDGRISAMMFQTGYPDWQRVEDLRDPLISSGFWRRVTER